ncbi:MAG: hypothetical protein RJA25_238 [Bacteroidota bacterium]|mgnify:FL=1|jgi:hypothetical protein
MRESVRLQKNEWYDKIPQNNQQLLVLINYQPKHLADFSTVHQAIKLQFEKIISILNRPNAL